MGLYTTVKTKGAKWTFSSLNTSWTLVPWAQSSGDLELLRIVIFTLFRDGCKVTEEKQKLLWLKLYSASVLLDHKSHLNILGLQVVCIVCYTLLLLCILLSLIIQTPLITTKPKDSQTLWRIRFYSKHHIPAEIAAHDRHSQSFQPYFKSSCQTFQNRCYYNRPATLENGNPPGSINRQTSMLWSGKPPLTQHCTPNSFT